MRAALVVYCLLLTLAPVRNQRRSKRSFRRTIWGSIRRNEDDLKKLTKAINETEQFQQEFGPIVDTLKENVDDMKEGFASQTRLMAQMKTSINEMKENIGHSQKDLGE